MESGTGPLERSGKRSAPCSSRPTNTASTTSRASSPRSSTTRRNRRSSARSLISGFAGCAQDRFATSGTRASSVVARSRQRVAPVADRIAVESETHAATVFACHELGTVRLLQLPALLSENANGLADATLPGLRRDSGTAASQLQDSEARSRRAVAQARAGQSGPTRAPIRS